MEGVQTMTTIGFEQCKKCGFQPSTYSYIGDPHYLIGSGPHRVEYNRDSDTLRITCDRCGYQWFKTPMNLVED